MTTFKDSQRKSKSKIHFNLSLQISIFFLFLLSGGGSFGLTDTKVSINQMLSHGTYMLHNGSIIPMDNENKVTYTEAIIVKDKRITFVGDASEAKRREPAAKPIDLNGKTLLPGFIEPHIHPSLAAIVLPSKIIAPFDWMLPNGFNAGAQTQKDYINRLTEALAKHKTHEKVFFTWGYHQLWHGKLSKHVLNKIAPNIPLIVIHRSFHEAYLNDKAIEILNLKKSDFIDHPQISWDKGHFYEGGFASIMPMLSTYILEPKSYARGLSLMSQMIRQNGITAIAEPGFANIHFESELKLLNEEMQKKPPYVVYLIPNAAKLEIEHKSRQSALSFIKGVTKFNTENIKFLNNHIKLFADGAIYSQAMQVSEGYNNDSQGKWMTPPEYLKRIFRFYWDRNFKIHIHANGDKGIQEVLNMVDDSNQLYPRAEHETTLHHMGYFTDSIAERIRKLGVEASINPFYLWALSEKYTETGLGAARAQNLVPAASLARRNINTSFHSDFAMAPLSPLTLSSTAITRKAYNSTKASQHQRMSRYDALKAITISAARTLNLHEEMGSIEIGKVANFVILDQNPMTVDPKDLPKLRIHGTMFEGIYYSNR